MGPVAGEEITHGTVSANGIRMHIAEKGAGPTVLFLHSFPELWYSWRHQISYLANRSYRAVAPDLRGFGDSDAPPLHTSYAMFHLVGDIVALIQELGEDKETERAEEEFTRIDTKVLMKKFLTYHDPKPVIVPKEKGFSTPPEKEIELPSWVSEEDVDYFTCRYKSTGFTGGVNYYRALDLYTDKGTRQVHSIGDQDLMYHFPGAKEYIHQGGFKKDVPLLVDVVVIEGEGHFINQEMAIEVVEHIYQFISKIQQEI